MKTLNDYMAMSIVWKLWKIKTKADLPVSYPDLPGCITCGETLERAVANAGGCEKKPGLRLH